MDSIIVCGDDSVAAAIASALAAAGHGVTRAADAAAVASAVAAAERDAKRVDALITVPSRRAAGATILETPEALWDDIMARDLTHVFRANKAVLPHLIAHGGGAIVNVARNSGYGRAHRLAESAAHGGIIAFDAALAYDHFNDRVRVNTIVTGDDATDAGIAAIAVFLVSSDAEVLSGSLIDTGTFAYQGGR